jgi:organic hydroperoxide reductase OsmC/OhrA
VQLLAAAVGNCLSDSLLFALRKFMQAPEPIRCEVQAQVGRNPEGRMRVLDMQATLTLGVEAAALAHLDRVLGQFEAFCTVSQSVAQGIPLRVEVFDALGVRLK